MPRKKVLVTGGAGFIGHHLIEHLLDETDWDIISLDGLNYATDVNGLFDMVGDSRRERFQIMYHDLRAPIPDALSDKIGKIDYIINVASGSHVDRSISHPVEFVTNNVALILNVLEYARVAKPEVFIQISTDEVYGAAAVGHSHVEWEPQIPSNPYAASKSAQESIAISYWRTYGVPVMITNTMNNFGENQNSEKFIPMVVDSLVNGREIKVHGMFDEGSKFISGSRVWLHAQNHAHAVRHILENVPVIQYCDGGDKPVKLHVSGEADVTNLEIVERAAAILKVEPKLNCMDFHSSRAGHDLRYSLNGHQLRGVHGWIPPRSFDESFRDTVLSLAKRFA